MDLDTNITPAPSRAPRGPEKQETFVYDRDTQEVGTLSDKQYAALQRALMSSLIGKQFTLRNIWEHLHTLSPWAGLTGHGFGGAYLTTLLDPHIVAAAHGGGGHAVGDNRITNTNRFMAQTSLNRPESSTFTETVNTVNAKHVAAGVVDWKKEGTGVEVTPYYRDSFMFVVGSIVDHIRLGLKESNVTEAEYNRLSQNIFQFIYQIGNRIGLTRMPRDLEAHDRFMAQHREKVTQQLRTMPRMQRRAADVAFGVLPSMAARVGCTVVQFLERYTDPDVTEHLHLLDHPEKIQELEREAEKIYRERYSIPGRMQTVYRWTVEKALGAPTHIQALRLADQDLQDRRQCAIAKALATGGDVVAAHVQGDSERVVHAVRECAEHDRTMNFEVRTFGAGEKIVRENDVSDCMYILVSMTHPLEVLASPRYGQPQERVATLEKPTSIGEIGMKRLSLRSATVQVPNVSGAQATLLLITPKQFDRLWKDSPHFARGIMRLIQRRIFDTSKKLAKERLGDRPRTALQEAVLAAQILFDSLEAFLRDYDMNPLAKNYGITHFPEEEIRTLLDTLEEMTHGILSARSKATGDIHGNGLLERLKGLEALMLEHFPEKKSVQTPEEPRRYL